MVKALLVSILVCSLMLSGVLADDTAECKGLLYRPKKSDVPVFDEPMVTGEVLYRLPLGTRVCYLGERTGFAIIDVSFNAHLRTGTTADARTVGYARLVDLWPPREPSMLQSSRDLFEQARSHLQQMYNGNVPDDVLSPYKEALGAFGEESCAASSCSKCEVNCGNSAENSSSSVMK